MDGKVFVIGITGTHCTGKTTLANKLATIIKQDGYNVRLVTETTRKVAKEKLGTLEGQIEVANLLAKEIVQGIKDAVHVIVTDRTFLDVIAYGLYYAIDRKWSVAECDKLIELIWKYIDGMRIYDVLVYANNRKRLPIVDDGFRLTDEDSRAKVDAILNALVAIACNDIDLFVWNVDIDPMELYEVNIKPMIKDRLGR